MAKEKIKGLTVQIGGDTTSLSKQLKALESKSKATAKELSAINRALKLDPTNTELLTQKQQVLAEQIATTKDKVDILRQAQQQAAEQLKNGDIGEDEYRKLQREVFFAEQSLDKLERQAAETDEALQEAGSAASDFGDDAGNAAQGTNEMGESVADLGSTMDDLKGKTVLAGKELVTLGAAGKLLQEGASSALDYNSALASIQAQTGASDAEMRSFKTAMDAVYNGGYGENLDEVAATMAQIAQSTHETDPGKLQELAEGALTLSDTFGFDTTESLRAVNMLMDQFGVTANQAYSLVVQGAQKGLNKNGDLMDVINEYSVHYRQMGYSADEFFASLENGAAAGTFSVDKLGDAMKEFGIRAKDTTASTAEAYELLGLDAAKMREQFAAGGESAQTATKTVLTSLMAMSDQVTQNQIGVDLFGTMWEDLGIDGVKALTNVSGSIDMTKDSMTELKEIKYSDVRSEWEQLGRSIQTDLVNPLGQKALPIAKKFVTWTKNNLNTLIPVAKTIGVVFGAMFVVSKVNAFISAVKGLVSAYKALRTAVQAANTTMMSNPYTALAMAIAAVVAATATMISSMHEAEREHDALVESYRDVARAAEESRQAQIEAARVTNEEYDNYQALWEELQTLVDANGRVKEGGEKRVEFIRSVLADATGQEIELVDGVIQKYDDLTRSISDALEMERARALQSGMQGSYDDAKSTLQGDDQTEGSQLYYERANKAYQDQLREIEAAQVISRRLMTERQNLERELSALQERTRYAITPEQQSQLDSLSSRLESVNEQARQAQDRIDDLNYEMEPIAADLESAAYALDVNLATVRNYEGLQKAILSGSVDDLTDAMYQASNSILSAEQSSISSLQSQQKTAKDAYDKLVAYSRQTGSKVTDEQLNAALRLKANTAIETYKALLAAGHDTSSAELQQLRQEISADLIELGDYTQTQLADVFKGFSTEARGYGANYAEGLAQGMESQEERVSNAAKRLANLTTASTRRTLQIASPSKVARSYGGYYSEGFALGITDKTPQAIRNVQRMSDEVISILNGAELPGGGYSLPAPLVERYSASGASADLSEMLDKLERIYSAVSSIDPRLVLDDGTLIGRTKDKIDRALGQKQILSDRGAR